MDTLGWNTLLFALKWVFIGLVYLVLVVIMLVVRREMTLRVRGAPVEAGFSPGRLRIVRAGSDTKMRPGTLIDLKPVTSLGSQGDNDLVLRDRFISGHHAQMRWDGAAWWIEDLGSRNGTQVNQERLQPRQLQRLLNGALVSLGDMSFELLE